MDYVCKLRKLLSLQSMYIICTICINSEFPLQTERGVKFKHSNAKTFKLNSLT